MATQDKTVVGNLYMPTDRIHAPVNVRELDGDHVDRLAGSIQLQGVLVPLIVSPIDSQPNGVTTHGKATHELVAGFHRLAAAVAVGLTEVPVIVRDFADDVDRAVENIVRKDLTPYEEAVALDRALTGGLSEAGAAQALGWAPKRVTERKRILELPVDAQKLIGDPFRAECVPLMIDVHNRAGKLWDRLMDSIAAEDTDGKAVTLGSLLEWAHNAAWRDATGVEAWPAKGAMKADDLPKMKPKLQDRWRGLVTKEYGYEREFTFSFTDTQLEQANAAGCYLDLGTRGLVLDKDLVMQFAEQAVTQAEAERADERAAKKKPGSKETVAFEATVKDPSKVLQSLERRDLRDTAPSTRAANVDLGRAMIAGLSTVELTKDVAVFFSRATLGPLWDGSAFGGERFELSKTIARRCALAVEELREVIDQGETKAGKPRPSKVEYAADDVAATWLRRWVEQPKDPAAILGRTLTVFAIASEVDMDVVTAAKRAAMFPHGLPGLPQDAERALARVAKSHVPGSMKGVRREKGKLKKARDDAYQQALVERRKTPAREPEQDDGEQVEA